MTRLLWTNKSLRNLEKGLAERGYKASYRAVDEIVVTADCGGSNGSRNRLWKYELQKPATETGKKSMITPSC
jgi:hypothetical protein